MLNGRVMLFKGKAIYGNDAANKRDTTNHST